MTKTSKKTQLHVAATLAPEDICVGDFVSTLSITSELPTFLWCDSYAGKPDELVRLRMIAPDAGRPMKVKSICLPFVYVATLRKRGRILDLRESQLVRLNKGYAKRIWKGRRKLEK